MPRGRKSREISLPRVRRILYSTRRGGIFVVFRGGSRGGGGVGWGVRTPLSYKSVGFFLSWVSSFGQQPLL